MNSRIYNTNVEDVLFFDAEFVGRSKEPTGTELELFQYKMRNRETDELPTEKETIEIYKRKSGLYPAFNKLVCITVGYIKDQVLYYNSITGEQDQILTQFYSMLATAVKYIPCGYNILNFDLPMLRMKAMESSISDLVPERYNESEKKPWNMTGRVIDLMDVIRGTYYSNLSLDEVCYMNGIESPKDFEGKDINKIYWSGSEDKIIDRCEKDVVACARLLCSFIGVEIKKVVNKTENIEKIPLVVKIFNSGRLTKTDERHILKLASDFTEDKKQKLLTVLKAATKDNVSQKLQLELSENKI